MDKPAVVFLKVSGPGHFGEEVSCLGSQLAKLLACIREETVDHHWYVSDLECYFHIFPLMDDVAVSYVKNTDELIKKVMQVIQFDYAVFTAIKKDIVPKWSPENLPSTEAKEGLQHPDADIEIRAFDFEAFEIYTRNTGIADKLRKVFPQVQETV